MSPPPAQLIRTYLEKRDTLLRVLTASLRHQDMAEDVLQELYLKIEKLNPGLQVDNPLGYLFRAANNIHLNRLRAGRSQAVRDEAWQGAHSDRLGTEAVASEPDAEARLIHKQGLAVVMSALADLDETTQAVVRLTRFEGLTQAETARRLNMSLATVERRLSQALRHLMQRHRQDQGGP